MLASLLFPYDDDAPAHIDAWLDELARESCIVRYKVDGNVYLEICNWRDHQKIDHPSKSKIPDPREASEILARTGEILALDLGPGPRIGEDLGRDQDIATDVANELECDPPETRKRVTAESVEVPATLSTPDFLAARDEWFKQRRRRRLSLRPEFVSRAYESLLPLGPTDAAACLRFTVSKDYSGIFPERYSHGQNKPHARIGAGQIYDPATAGSKSDF